MLYKVGIYQDFHFVSYKPYQFLMTLTDGELEGAVLEGCVVGAEDDGMPDHDVVVARRAGHARWRVLLMFLN